MIRINVHKVISCLLVLVCLAVLGATGLFAQGTTSTITGVVTDSTGAVIPQAAVAILNQRTGVDFHLETNSAGVYSITSLIPGVYTVTVSHKGFQTYTNRDLTLTVNQVLRIDVQMEVGSETQTITVEAAAPLVNTEEGRLSGVVNASQVQNMPLNGRNIYQLMQLVPGAVNSTGVNLEIDNGGSTTNINGARADFNGFFLDGVSNKGLDGNSYAQPAPEFVQEFRIMTNNYSAQYGNSAGSVTDVSIKSGTNSLHGDAWEYFRNDKLNARNFFDGDRKQLWRQNQFGFDIGGPIKKDRLFFFGGYEGQRFRTEAVSLNTIETPEWRQAVQSAMPNSTAALLYKDFPGPTPTQEILSVDDFAASQAVDYYGVDVGDYYGTDAVGNDAGLISSYYLAYTDPCFLNYWNGVGMEAYNGGPAWGNPEATANKFASLFGVTAEEQAQIQTNINTVDGCAGMTAPAVQSGAISRSTAMLGLANTKFPTRQQGVFYNGDQFVGRIDYQGDKNRIFGRVFHSLQKNPNYDTGITSSFRGSIVPSSNSYPNVGFGFVRSISPTIVNEFRAGYTRSNFTAAPAPSEFGVPNAYFDTGEVSFGAYNGYPQFFIENVFNYSDMVGIVAGKHSLKFGAEVKRNQENSEFNVGRPSYYFFDIAYFATDLPYWEFAGVNPELFSGGSQHLDTNIRAWRNTELGFYVQDDWKVSKKLTINLGLRWDYFGPHKEKYGHATQFVFGPGSTADERLLSLNCQVQVEGNCVVPAGDTLTPNGGFMGASELFKPDKNNFSPRFGFAWDPFGNGKTAIRGGFAVVYNSTIFNPLSNSRWNPPYYSFNLVCPICGVPGLPVYGPTNADGTPNTTATPTYGGAPDDPGQGPAEAGFTGNLMGWYPSNPILSGLTGIPDPAGFRTPYMENGFFGIQQELSPSTVLEVNWVGTFGKKLYWAENPNRVIDGESRDTVINPCTGENAAPTPFLNPCFGILRTWKNSVNSNYNALQVQLNRKMSGGLAFTTSYTWSHSLDFRSDWHGLSSGGSADWANANGSSGYSLDPNAIFLEYGNSGFDIRHRFTSSIVWDLPWLKSQQGAVGKAFGGWQANSIISLQSGFPFTVGARADYNGDGIRSDRPDIASFGNSYNFKNGDFLLGSGPDGGSLMQSLAGDFPIPEGRDGTLGRNTFFGPGVATVDFSLFKKIPFNERFALQFRAEFFNLFNRVNLYQPVANLASRNFGLSTQAFDPRVIQFGLRLSF